MFCKKCGLNLGDNPTTCPGCGLVINPAPTPAPSGTIRLSACPKCGTASNGKNFCRRCGTQLTIINRVSTPPVEPPVVTPQPDNDIPKVDNGPFTSIDFPAVPVAETPQSYNGPFAPTEDISISSLNNHPAPETDEHVCPMCGNVPDFTKRFCIHCGTKLNSGTAPEAIVTEEHEPEIEEENTNPVCPSCGKVEERGRKFCTTCGTKLIIAAEIPAKPEIEPEPISVDKPMEIPVVEEKIETEEEEKTGKRCPYCNNNIIPGKHFCMFCGKPIPVEIITDTPVEEVVTLALEETEDLAPMPAFEETPVEEVTVAPAEEVVTPALEETEELAPMPAFEEAPVVDTPEAPAEETVTAAPEETEELAPMPAFEETPVEEVTVAPAEVTEPVAEEKDEDLAPMPAFEETPVEVVPEAPAEKTVTAAPEKAAVEDTTEAPAEETAVAAAEFTPETAEPEEYAYICFGCGAGLKETHNFCPHCAMRINYNKKIEQKEAELIPCRCCGEDISSAYRYCRFCGEDQLRRG